MLCKIAVFIVLLVLEYIKKYDERDVNLYANGGQFVQLIMHKQTKIEKNVF